MFYVTIHDPHGAEYYDGTPVPITTRLLFDKGVCHGQSSLERMLPYADKQAHLPRLLMLMSQLESGTMGRLTWTRE